jgi:hypothetical protein
MRKTIIFRISRMRIHLLQQAEQPRTVSKHGGGGLQQQLQLSQERVSMITAEENLQRATIQRIILMRNK